ncbi:RDD family protein [Streptomyces sp. NPDC051776]|uniref:RDD family protein n=1 Tax=Streptomyces sp. NPDC051776 TaxID=3155414 RepID=UPI00342A718D
MSYPPGPGSPYGEPQQGQPYGYPQQQPGFPQQQPGFPQQQGYPAHPGGGSGYGLPGAPAGMPPFAAWGTRVGAALVDFLITGLVPMILMIAGYAQIIGDGLDSASKCDPDDQACLDSAVQSTADGSGGAIALILIGALLSIVASLWLVYKEGRTGRTPGKKAMKISVLREADGQPLGFGMAFVRRLCHTLDGMACYIGFLWPLWDEKKQTFADKIVKSVVVRTQ